MITSQKGRFSRTFRFTLKLSGWIPAALGALALGGFLAIYNSVHAPLVFLQRVVEVITPLAFGLHAAFVLAPENEPAIELLLSYPKPLSHHLRDRLLLIAVLHGGTALLASLLIAFVWHVTPFGALLLRWLIPAILLGGLAVFTTQLTRQSAFGALLTTLMWASSLYGGDALVKRWPWAWPFHAYLQAQNTTSLHYFLNRILLIAIGLGLMFAAAWFLQNDERMLGSK